MSFDLLSENIKKYIYSKNWTSLRPIQAAAIDKIINTDFNYILSSKTASGKTEAAFLPIISNTNFNNNGVQVLYISPLIALINDQFYRIIELCADLEIPVVKWHGEANISEKKKLIKNPKGIVLITPESLEAMFVNNPYNIKHLFGNLKYIILDEVHSFIGSDRGIQLKSLFSRIQSICTNKIITIGLSATVGKLNYDEVKKMIGSLDTSKILLDNSKNDSKVKFKFFDSDSKNLPLDLIKDIYKESLNSKTLIFPNSRGRVEEIAVKLKKISNKVNGNNYYFSHHSSIDKEIRENIEHFAKNNERFNFCISCTSTLELGIDIGTIDKIIQVDSTFSVSSLVQRLGRSGRRDEEQSNIVIYATDKWSLLQSLACWNLYNSDFLEPLRTSELAYDILLHQMLSILKQLNGCEEDYLLNFLTSNKAFSQIGKSEIKTILDYSVSRDYIEIVGSDLILGLEGEKIVNSREFYSVFISEANLNVFHSGKKIGELPFSPQIQIDQNILLAARIWKIKFVDLKVNRIEVMQASDGKKPIFFAGVPDIHNRIREEMLEIIQGKSIEYDISELGLDALKEVVIPFKDFKINDIQCDRPIIQKENSIEIYTFSSSKINRTLLFLFKSLGFQVQLEERKSMLVIITDLENLENLIHKAIAEIKNIDKYILDNLEKEKLDFTKWGKYLPSTYQVKILKDRYFDFVATKEFLSNVNLVRC